MADYLTRACRLQLTTAMENLIRTAVFEISQIFEDSLHDHQMELARKGEEIAYLKIKLQRAELMLKEVSAGSGSDPVSNPSSESHGASEEAGLQSSADPEIEYEVPDDWCVPLDSEYVTKHENICPSVRLRQFSITLSPISLKHEAFRNLDASRLRSRHMDSTQTGLQEESPPKRKRGRPRLSEQGKVKDLLMNIKKESFDREVEPLTQRVGRKAKEPKVKELRKTNMKTEANRSAGVYHCRFCPKEFNTPFGLSVHDRAHRKCKGCKRVFPLQSALKQHKKTCKLYQKKIVERKDINKAHITPSSVRKRNLFTCRCCLKTFDTRSHLVKHPCFVSCQTCHKRLSSQIALATHVAKLHTSTDATSTKLIQKKQKVQKKLNASCRKPLIKSEKSHDNFTSTDKAKGQIKECSKGFKCLICKKIYSSKYFAFEHLNVHTGEKPFKCAVCSQTFCKRNSLSIHRKKHHGLIIRNFFKCSCSKRFFDKSKYREHKLSCPKGRN